MSKSNRFCFTKNNYTEFDVRLLDDDSVYSKFKYLIFGKEVGENGTPHLQGYVEFENSCKLRITAAKARFEGLGLRGYHLEVAKGSAAQNITYCSKDNDFIEHGERPKGQGKRTDLDVVCEEIKGGASMYDIADRYPSQFVKFGNGLEKLIQIRTKRRFFKTEVWWLWGPTGTGKSRWAWDQCPDAYMKCSTHKWWSGYFGQEEVIMDDYRPCREMPFDFMLLLMDRYPLSVETKGGMAEFTAKKIYVTSPFSPEAICNHLEWIGTEKKEQFLRRIDHVIEFPQLATMYSQS
jgi:hypothetical protein